MGLEPLDIRGKRRALGLATRSTIRVGEISQGFKVHVIAIPAAVDAQSHDDGSAQKSGQTPRSGRPASGLAEEWQRYGLVIVQRAVGQDADDGPLIERIAQAKHRLWMAERNHVMRRQGIDCV